MRLLTLVTLYLLLASFVATCSYTLPLVTGVPGFCGSSDSDTGWGIEFLMPYTTSSQAVYGGGSASDACTSSTAIFAAMRYNHPAWTWQDIKGAIRQTASNWSTGYNPLSGGYGVYNYSSANSVSNTSSIYLQPPNISIIPNASNETATLTVYPYTQTRRDHEAVYQFNSAPNFSAINELTPSSLAALCGTLIYDDRTYSGYQTPGVTPNVTLYFASAGTYYFIPFTIDSAGNASRIESFSATQVITVPDLCK